MARWVAREAKWNPLLTGRLSKGVRRFESCTHRLILVALLLAAGCAQPASGAIQSTNTTGVYLDARDAETLLWQVAYDEIARDLHALKIDCRNGVVTLHEWRARALQVLTGKVRNPLIAAYDEAHTGLVLCAGGVYSPFTAKHLGRAVGHLFEAMDAVHGLSGG